MAKPTRFLAVGAAVAASGLLAGGVFAASITNFAATTLAVGSAPLASCFDDADTTMTVDAGTPAWNSSNQQMEITNAIVNITDTVNQSSTVACDAHTVKIVAVNSGGTEITNGTATISGDGDVTNLTVTLGAAVDATAITDWAIAVYK